MKKQTSVPLEKEYYENVIVARVFYWLWYADWDVESSTVQYV